MRHVVNEMFGTRRVAAGRSVELARQALSEVFLPVDFPTARASSTLDLRLNAVTVGRVTCGYMRFRDAVRMETAEATNFHIDIPTRGRATMRAAHCATVHGTAKTAAVFMPGRPAVLDCGERFSQIALMIPRDQLQLELENLLGDRAARPLEFDAELQLTTPGGRLLIQTLRMVDGASAQEAGALDHPLAAQRLEQVLLHGLLFGQPHNYSDALAIPSPSAGVRPVTRAVELVRSDPAHP